MLINNTFIWSLGLSLLLCGVYGAFFMGFAPNWVYIAMIERRLPDDLNFTIQVVYNCSNDSRRKIASLEDKLCGLPKTGLVFQDQSKEEVYRSATTKHGFFHRRDRSSLDHPLTKARFLRVENNICSDRGYPLTLEKELITLGESLSAYRYRYRLSQTIECVVNP